MKIIIMVLMKCLISFNSYSSEYEYGTMVIPVYNTNYDLCYYTLKKSENIYILQTKANETCGDFLVFNKMIEDSMPNKAHLPFSGEIEAINYDERLIKKIFYELGLLKKTEFYKSGSLVLINYTDSSKFLFFDHDERIKLQIIDEKDFTMISMFKDSKKVLEFFPESNEPPIIDKDIANKLQNLKTFKFKIELNENGTINNYYFYTDMLQVLSVEYYHDDLLSSKYSYGITKENDSYKYKLSSITFYNGSERILYLSFDSDNYQNYSETRYLKADKINYFYKKENVNSDKWVCKNLDTKKVINDSECLKFNQTEYNNIMNTYVNSYKHPLYPDDLFIELGFK